jgi:hypothetical protein
MNKIDMKTWIAVGLLVTLGATAQAEVGTTSVVATVANYKGKVEYAEPGTTAFKPVSQEEPIPAGSTLRTGPNSFIAVVPFPGAALTLGENGELSMPTLNIGTENNKIVNKTAVVDLKQGMVTVSIDHQAADKIPVDFKVATATGVASAVGTQYVVAVVNGITYVKVLDGTVGLAGHNGGPINPINSTSGVGMLNKDGHVSTANLNTLPPDVQTALNNAPIEDTTGYAVIGADPFINKGKRVILFNSFVINPNTTIQGARTAPNSPVD